MDQKSSPYLLGLDLGVQSVGWAIIDLDKDGKPCGIRQAGVRCFDSGVGSETEIAMGKDESANKPRRDARLQRRQTWRRARRLKKVFLALQKAGLLPPEPVHSSEERHQLLLKLDAELAKEYLRPDDRVTAHLLPYRLRYLALDQSLPPFAIGRALYHLAQRRGFLSNRKANKKEDDEGVVKEGIKQLREDMEHTSARTLGEYYASLDPEEKRIRARWTSRQMYLDEFEMICAAQQSYHPELLTEGLKQRIHEAIFYQRPLKSQKGLIGICELEPDQKRAPWASLEAQRFRYIQKINDLEIATPEGKILPLDSEQRQKLIEAMENQAEISFDKIRTLLGLKTSRRKKVEGEEAKTNEPKYTFNLEGGGEKKLKGNVTMARLKKELGDELAKLTAEQLAKVIEDLIEYEKKDALEKRLVERYGLSPEKAAVASDVTLEDGYCSLSLKALRKILPLMEDGMRFATARKQVYGEYSGASKMCDYLPPVLQAKSQLRNPVVTRGLTELRKVVNAITGIYDKPAFIHVELARDLKRSRKQREDITKQNRQNEKAREDAKKRILQEIGGQEPRPGDILKVLLAEESNWECPYTGKPISMSELIGGAPKFDIEHIIPFSRSFDNSFMNKTLCHHEENRNVKKNQMPFEAYSGHPDKYSEIIARVKRFKGSAGHTKLRKFLQEKMEEDFSARHLQDTRYMSRLATEYLGLLYGGAIDAEGRRRIQVSAGRITAYLRDEWELNAILNDGGNEKNRDDHRHHAVDAIVIALTNADTIEYLTRAALQAEQWGRRLFAPMDKPWTTFLDEVRGAIDAINISYRVNRRVSGALHEETYYSNVYKAQDKNGKSVEYRHVRKPLVNMSMDEMNSIVDPTIRDLVREKLNKLGGEPKKAFADPNNLPYIQSKGGHLIPIKKARIRKNVSVIPLNKQNTRFAAPGSNHHMEIVAVLNDKGEEIEWEGHIVSLFEAYRRRKAHEPVIQRDHGTNKKFKFSLAGGEYLELTENGEKRLVRINVITGNVVFFRLHNDSRPVTILRKTKGGFVGLTKAADALRKAKARKVVVDPLGNIIAAND
jgi:CRISPR-associated endonuclease Csn1